MNKPSRAHRHTHAHKYLPLFDQIYALSHMLIRLPIIFYIRGALFYTFEIIENWELRHSSIPFHISKMKIVFHTLLENRDKRYFILDRCNFVQFMDIQFTDFKKQFEFLSVVRMAWIHYFLRRSIDIKIFAIFLYFKS